MREHELKCWPSQFEALRSGRKTFEVRQTHDRDFAVGDVLVLRNYDPHRREWLNARGQRLGDMEQGAELRMLVTYVLHGGQFGLPADVCVMAVRFEATP